MADYSGASWETAGDVHKSMDESVRAIVESWNATLLEHKGEHFRATEEIVALQKAITEEHRLQKELFGQHTEANKKKLVEIETFYTEGLRTQAPTKYWSSKATSHSVLGYVSLSMFVLGALVFAWIAYSLGQDVISAVAQVPDGANAAAGNQQFVELGTALSRFLVFLVPSFFAVWLLRTILRISLSNLAVADDARHRVTLIQTFRSLLEHEKKLEAADRILMLQALFRPSPGSSRDDESAPPNWFDVLVSRLKPGK